MICLATDIPPTTSLLRHRKQMDRDLQQQRERRGMKERWCADRWIKKEGVGCCRIFKSHDAAAESWKSPSQQPGWSRSPASWCSSNPALHSSQTFHLFLVIPPLSQLTKKLGQSAGQWMSECVTTGGVCYSFTNVQHHCSKVLQCYSWYLGSHTSNAPRLRLRQSHRNRWITLKFSFVS